MLVEPLLVRSQSYFSQGSVSEYVEDSEPEREELRTKVRSRQKKTRVEAPIPPLVDVIELTDSDDVSYLPSHPHAHLPEASANPTIVIDVSDSSDDLTSHSKHVESEEVPFALPDIRDGSLSGLEDATTDDSLPSIGGVFNLPPRGPRTSITVNRNTSGPVARAPQLLKETPALLRTSPFPGVIGSCQQDKRNPPQLHQMWKLSLCPPLSPSRTAESSESEGEGGGPIKLGHFAYTAPNLVRRTASKTPSPTYGDSIMPEVGATDKAKRPISHRFADFSDSQLSRVLKCVSCELAWTARKTVPQKMKHIQTCAKKNGLTDDTVRILLRKELDSAPPVASSSNSTTPAPASDSVSETLLEDVLKGAGKKKHGRRPPVMQTVKNVEETRRSILDRARSLLANGSSSCARDSIVETADDLHIPPATQMFRKSNVAAREECSQSQFADTTQVFGPSKLAGRSSRLQSAIVHAGIDIAAQSDISPLTQVPGGIDQARQSPGTCLDEVEAPPPSTQVFARSKLTNASGVGMSHEVATLTADIPDDPISIHDTSEDDFTRSSPARPIVTRSPPSSSAKSPQRSRQDSPRAAAPLSPPLTRRRRREPSPAGEAGREENVWAHSAPPEDDNNDHWNDWIHDVWGEGDDACLHYVPDTQTAGAGPSDLQGRNTSASPPLPQLVAIHEDALAYPPAGIAVVAGPGSQAQTKKKRRKKGTAEESDVDGKPADVPQDELNAKMKEAILKNEVLHLRILRYEPIHFDVFLQMAVDLGMSAKRSGLKIKVRTFLDQKVGSYSRFCPRFRISIQ
ncbi:hypothetical protein BC628DRAFT_1414781 [Trametes gibbosa]|nr:hypothetical protein BC628DRAFT_1414781 [Trametes gibbosa]